MNSTGFENCKETDELCWVGKLCSTETFVLYMKNKFDKKQEKRKTVFKNETFDRIFTNFKANKIPSGTVVELPHSHPLTQCTLEERRCRYNSFGATIP